MFWDEGLGGSFVSLGLTGGSRQFTTVDTLETGRTYKFKAKAINYIGTGPESDIGYLVSAAPPDPPAGISQGIATEQSIRLSWDAPYDGGAIIQNYAIFETEISL